MIRKLLKRFAWPLTAIATLAVPIAIFASVGTAHATPTRVVADGVVVDYQETGNWCGNGPNGPCTTHVTIVANPQDRAVRAWQQCSGGGVYTGGTYYNVGQESTTGSCAQGFYVSIAGFQYELARFQWNCYAHPQSWTGRCP
jgi:hypothetical protein